MTLNIQIAVDCRNPHELADWWAETLEWAVEPQDEVFIHSMIDQGFATEAETVNTTASWCGGRAPPSVRPTDSTPKPRPPHPLPGGPGSEDRQEPHPLGREARRTGQGRGVGRLEARGATYLRRAARDRSWYTMGDPEGNEFCIS